MIENLESDYSCSRAGADLERLHRELNALRGEGDVSMEVQENINRLENQIRFIQNKCDIH